MSLRQMTEWSFIFPPKDYHQNGRAMPLETSPLAKPAEVVLPSVLTEQHHKDKADDSKSTSFKVNRLRCTYTGYVHYSFSLDLAGWLALVSLSVDE